MKAEGPHSVAYVAALTSSPRLVHFGSFASDRYAARGRGMSAFRRKRTINRRSRDVCFVPERDLDAGVGTGRNFPTNLTYLCHRCRVGEFFDGGGTHPRLQTKPL